MWTCIPRYFSWGCTQTAEAWLVGGGEDRERDALNLCLLFLISAALDEAKPMDEQPQEPVIEEGK